MNAARLYFLTAIPGMFVKQHKLDIFFLPLCDCELCTGGDDNPALRECTYLNTDWAACKCLVNILYHCSYFHPVILKGPEILIEISQCHFNMLLWGVVSPVQGMFLLAGDVSVPGLAKLRFSNVIKASNKSLSIRVREIMWDLKYWRLSPLISSTLLSILFRWILLLCLMKNAFLLAGTYYIIMNAVVVCLVSIRARCQTILLL